MTLMQTAQLLGNFGEFVGAIAVVITLVYLAIQVRHSRRATQSNTEALRRAAATEQTNNYVALSWSVVERPELADLLVEIRNVRSLAELSDPARLRAAAFLTATLKTAEHNYLQWQDGYLEERLGRPISIGTQQMVKSLPWFEDHWTGGGRDVFSDDFGTFIDSTLASSAGGKFLGLGPDAALQD